MIIMMMMIVTIMTVMIIDLNANELNKVSMRDRLISSKQTNSGEQL